MPLALSWTTGSQGSLNCGSIAESEHIKTMVLYAQIDTSVDHLSSSSMETYRKTSLTCCTRSWCRFARLLYSDRVLYHPILYFDTTSLYSSSVISPASKENSSLVDSIWLVKELRWSWTLCRVGYFYSSHNRNFVLHHHHHTLTSTSPPQPPTTAAAMGILPPSLSLVS